MRLRIEHVGGARAGETETFEQDVVRIGRDPDRNDVKLHPDEDIEASARHASIRREDGAFWVVDADSAGGTFVNGEEVRRRRLSPGDVVRCSPDGPELRVHFDAPDTGDAGEPSGDDRADATMIEGLGPPRADDAAHSTSKQSVGVKTISMMISDALKASREEAGGGRTTKFVRELVDQAVHQSTVRQRFVAGALLALTVACFGFVYWQQAELEAESAASLEALSERAEALQGRNQELQTRYEDLRGRHETLSGELAAARAELDGMDDRMGALQQEVGRVAARDEEERRRLQEGLDQERRRREELAGELEELRRRSLAAHGSVAEAAYLIYGPQLDPDTGEPVASVPYCTAFALDVPGALAGSVECVQRYLDTVARLAARDTAADGSPATDPQLLEFRAVRRSQPGYQYEVVDAEPDAGRESAAAVAGSAFGVFRMGRRVEPRPDLMRGS